MSNNKIINVTSFENNENIVDLKINFKNNKI